MTRCLTRVEFVEQLREFVATAEARPNDRVYLIVRADDYDVELAVVGDEVEVILRELPGGVA